MYEDLIKQLRYCANNELVCGGTSSCPYYDKAEEETHFYRCVERMMEQAADAVEDLTARFNAAYAVGWAVGEEAAKSKMPQWIPVSERLPEEKTNPNTLDFEYVLCATTFGDVRAYKFGTPIGWDKPHFWNGGGLHGVMDRYVTHWMPLPGPPKDGK